MDRDRSNLRGCGRRAQRIAEIILNEMVGPNISVPDRVAGAALGALRIALLAIMLVVVETGLFRRARSPPS